MSAPYKRIFLMVVFDSIILLLLIWLIAIQKLPILPTALVVYPFLLIANFVFVRRIVIPSTSSYRKFKVPIFGAIVFTVACAVQIMFWVKEPDVRSTVQVAIGLLLSSYVWFVVHALRKLNRDDSSAVQTRD